MTHPPHTSAKGHDTSTTVRLPTVPATRLVAALMLAASVALFCGCPAGGLTPPIPSPTLTGCPERDVLTDEPVTLTISISDGMVLGVATTSISLDTDVAVTRVDDRTFTVVVTSRAVGNTSVMFAVDSDMRVTSTTLSCDFPVITRLGACCESFLCDLTDENECFFRDGVFHGPATTCDPNPCSGACCGLQPGGNTCAELPQANCEAEGGQYQGGGSTCTTGCPCDTAADCPDDGDSCTNAVCEGGLCGQRSACAGGTPCDLNGQCPIQITVDFPTSLMNGEAADLTIYWSGDSHFRKTGQFFTRFGACPGGFACPSKTLTLENAQPFVIPNAFTCRIDGATEPVAFTYEAILTDWNGVGSNIATVEFTCVP